MERITYRMEDQHGNKTDTIVYSTLVVHTGDSIFPKSKFEEIALKRLSEYEDAEEQGRLLMLPCKIGTPVYRVVRCRVDATGYRMEWEWETCIETAEFHAGMIDSIGKTIFLTRKEAEAYREQTTKKSEQK